jgi:hypothetical protein
MTSDSEEYLRGPQSRPTDTERYHVKRIIEKVREKLKHEADKDYPYPDEDLENLDD